MSDTYQADIICRNCGYSYVADIEKGISVFDFLYMKNCPKCGCRQLHKDIFKELKNEQRTK